VIFTTPYETTLGKAWRTNDIENKLQRTSVHLNSTNPVLGVHNLGYIYPRFITGTSIYDEDIPLFNHPLIVKDSKDYLKQWVCSDIRPFVSVIKDDTGQGENTFRIKNKSDVEFIKLRTILTMYWLNRDYHTIRLQTVYAATIFANWLSDSIGNYYSLDAKDKLLLTVVSFVFYQCQFDDSGDWDSIKDTIVGNAVSQLNLPANQLYDLIDNMRYMKNTADYVEQVKHILENVRLNKFDSGILYTIIGHTWFGGFKPKENIVTALEHPPTWITITYMAYKDQTYRNAAISRLLARFTRNQVADTFAKNVELLVADVSV